MSTYRIICNYVVPSATTGEDEVHEHLSSKTFTTLEGAQRYLSSISPSREPKILLQLSEDHTDVPTRERLAVMQRELDRILLPWEEDGCIPPNLVRLTAAGTKVCEVNRWCGGFQSVHDPTTIGWKVTGYTGGVVLVDDYDSVGDAIEAAKERCHALVRSALSDKYEIYDS